jgi:CRISPR-associated protein Cas1
MAGLTHHLRRAGVCTASGFGIKVFVQRGQLLVEDGFGRDRRRRGFNRATHGISRIVVIGSDGFISLEAIRWLHRLGIALIHLDRDGNILATSAPNGGDVRLRRLQALAGGSETGVEIARLLLQAKLDGQARVLELLNPDEAASGAIVRAAAALGEASTLDQLVWAERDAALAYWTAWESIAVAFGRPVQRQVPDHWLRFGQRGSLLTSGPRLAINPANAMLNYLYAILEAETRLACLTVGLDPGLGIVHVDYRSRDSFALDLMEAARPAVDEYLVELLQGRTFTRHDFAETARGVCRVNPPLSHELAETAPRWAEAIAPVAEAVAHELARSEGSRIKQLSTPLTGSNRSARYVRTRRRVTAQAAKAARPAPTCKRCGGPVPRRTRTYCDSCLPHYQREQYETAFNGSGLSAIERKRAAGCDPTHGEAAAARRAETNITRKRQAREWDEEHGKLVDLSAFQRDILPRIQDVPLSRLQRATGLSLRYVSLIRRGERTPHPRHWHAFRDAAHGS